MNNLTANRTRRLSLFTLLLAALTILGSCSKSDGDDIPPTVSITITFDTDGGSAIEPITVTAGVKVTAPTPPTKAGFTFKEWQLEGTIYDFDLATTKNITVKAIWTTNTYTVTFDTNGGSAITAQTVAHGNKATKPNPTKAGYSIKEWQLDGKAYDFDTATTKDITLKAVWTISTYTVTFDTDGGNAITTQTITHGSKATKPTDPTKTEYTFKEWQVDGTVFDFNTTVTVAITIKAVWTINNYTVTFDTDGGSAVATQTIDYNNKATKPNPTKTGYLITEWQLNGTAYDFNTAVTVAITLKAVWGINGTSTDWTIDTDADGNATIRKYNNTSTAEIVIPAFVDGKKIISIKGTAGVGIFNQSAAAQNSTITSIDLSNAIYLTSIEDSAFTYLTSITSIIIPSGVTSIGVSIFSNCTALESIIIPNSVTSIGGSAFEYCIALTSIIIPASVESIGLWGFLNCSALTSVTIKRVSPLTTLGGSVFSSTPMADASTESTFYYPTGADYQNATGWKEYKTKSTWTAQD